MRGIFEQSALKIRANDQRLLVCETAMSWSPALASWFL
jgi:hypothetical protein